MTGPTELRVLGGVTIIRSGSELTVSTTMLRRMLAVLLARGGQPIRARQGKAEAAEMLRDVLDRYERLGDPQADKVRKRLENLE